MIWRLLSRPPMLLAYAAVALVVALALGWLAVDAARSGGATERVTVQLDGPHQLRRSVNERWDLTGAAGGGHVGDVELGPRDSDDLADWSDETVSALVHGDTVVAVETPDGRTYRNLRVGVRGVVFWTVAALVVLVGAWSLLRHARGRGESRAVAPVVVAALSIGVLMSLGAAWQLALAIGLAAGVVAALLLLRARRHERAFPGRRVRGTG